MKTTIKHYFITFMIILIPSLIFSLIFSTLSYFIQWNGTIFHFIIQVIAYIVLIVSALYFSSVFINKRLYHCLTISFLYALLHLVIHLDSLNLINLALKSSVFILIGLTKEFMQKKRWYHHLFLCNVFNF